MKTLRISIRPFRISTKTKKEIRYFASLSLMLIASMCLLAFLTSCSKKAEFKQNRTKTSLVEVFGGQSNYLILAKS